MYDFDYVFTIPQNVHCVLHKNKQKNPKPTKQKKNPP